jgi:hypothetical protein
MIRETLYLKVRSDDSYLRQQGRGEALVLTIKDVRHVRYWIAQRFPVLLVIRNSHGEIHWMEISDWLKQASRNNQKPVPQIVLKGERFDVMSVRRWRDRLLIADSS